MRLWASWNRIKQFSVRNMICGVFDWVLWYIPANIFRRPWKSLLKACGLTFSAEKEIVMWWVHCCFCRNVQYMQFMSAKRSDNNFLCGTLTHFERAHICMQFICVMYHITSHCIMFLFPLLFYLWYILLTFWFFFPLFSFIVFSSPAC